MRNGKLSGILKRLEKHGFITTSVNKADRRVKDICLTEKARRMEEIARADKKQMEDTLVKGLSEEEIETLRALLKKVLNNMTGE